MGNQKKRILHITSSLGVGGAETMLYRLVRELQGRDDQAHSIISLTDNCSFDFAALGVHVDVLDLKKPINILLGVVRLREMIRKYKPDVIQGWMYHGNLAATISSPSNVPVLWSIHHSLHDLKNEKLSIRFLVKAGAFLSKKKNMRKIVFVSENGMKHHIDRGYPADKSIVIPNGFDCVEFSPDESSRRSTRHDLGYTENYLVVGSFGRYHPVKDHELLLHAFAEVKKVVPHARLLLAGIGVAASNTELSNVIKELGVVESVLLLGPRKDMPGLYNAIDLYALSSKSEAFPNVLGEASACGVLSVTTNVGDASRIIGTTGSVVPSGNTDLMRDALVQLLTLDRSERISLGGRARQYVVDNFSLSVVAKTYGDLYISMLV